MDLIQGSMIRSGEQIDKSDSRKDVILAIFTEISRPKMTFIGITQGLTQKTLKTTGKLTKERPGREKPITTTLRISTRLKKEGMDSKAHRMSKIEQKQMNMATLKKKLNGEVDTPKMRKSSTRRTSMGTLLDLKKTASTAPTGGIQNLRPILKRNTMTLYRTLTNSRSKDPICIKRRKRCIRSMSLTKIQILVIRTGVSKLDKICSGGKGGQRGSIRGR